MDNFLETLRSLDIIQICNEFKEILFISLILLIVIYQDYINDRRIKKIDNKFKMVIKRLKIVNPEDLLKIGLNTETLNDRIKKSFKKFLGFFKRKRKINEQS